MSYLVTMMLLKSGRATFHAKRMGFAILRVAIYSCVCGLFFMLGMELGRHEMIKLYNKSPLLNASQMSQLNQIVADAESNNEESVWKENGEGHQGAEPGILPLPNQMRPGEMGKPFKPTKLTEEQRRLMKLGWDKNAINQYVSDLISVERTLPDVRHTRCKEPNKYRPNLPKTSVIICFHNEAWSILLRSVHSVLNRSPPELLKEVVLVDDCSTMDHLKDQLEQYMQRFPKVRIVRASARVGLIKARMMGARAATGKILTFLDSHIEATTGWLPPLLDRIARNFTTVVCPLIDVIDDDTLEYKYDQGSGDAVIHSIGVFDWTLTFNWQMMPERIRAQHNDTSEPFHTPTMAGGLFAISKRFFEHLGMYDPEFDIWGGENLELSFKTWMCGGTLEIVPCSHVGHIFRRRSPYEWRKGKDVIRRNLVRLAKVWTDEYSKYYFEKINNELGDYGDISDRLALRQRLNCKPFKWYVKNVFPEIFIPDRGYAHGQIQNLGDGARFCLDSKMDPKASSTPIVMFPCHGQGGNQYFTYTFQYEIRRDETCVDYAGDKVMQFPCHGAKGNQEWRYDQRTKQIIHQVYGKCLTTVENRSLAVLDCSHDDINQKWKFQNYNPNAVLEVNND